MQRVLDWTAVSCSPALRDIRINSGEPRGLPEISQHPKVKWMLRFEVFRCCIVARRLPIPCLVHFLKPLLVGQQAPISFPRAHGTRSVAFWLDVFHHIPLARGPRFADSSLFCSTVSAFTIQVFLRTTTRLQNPRFQQKCCVFYPRDMITAWYPASLLGCRLDDGHVICHRTLFFLSAIL